MEVRAVAKFIRVQPRKVRLVAREVRGAPAALAAHKLRFHPSKGAKALHKVLVSAMANAQENHGISPDLLRISNIAVDEGPHMKRMQARAMGRGNRILKKTSHITVTVEDYDGEQTVKPHGTKAKPRPTLAGKRGKKGSAPAAPEAAAPVAEVVEEVTTPEITSEEVAEVVESVEVTQAAAETEAAAEATPAPTEEGENK
ncbi:RplV Ribosomal protein L22 [Fimbriimonadaceae bacterium]|jgi:large subunit ribosomal protein L22